MNKTSQNLRRLTSSDGPASLQAAIQTLESPSHAKEKRQVLDAIKALGLQVKVSDVAATTGLPVLKVTELLNRVAYETEGHLLIDTNGGVAYKFASNFESHYWLKGSKHFFQRTARVTYNALALCLRLITLAVFMAVRASFGILLIASVVLVIAVVVAIVVVCLLRVLSMFSDSGGDSGGDMFDLPSVNFDWLDGLRFWTIDWIWDWWYWPRYYTNWSPSVYIEPSRTEPKTVQRVSDPDGETESDTRSSGGNFLDNCFALLFGAGDPNANIEEERWQLLAKAIKAKSGVVIAEDLAPYAQQTDRDENWMLPILVRFNGCPEVVTNHGKIIYTFPAFIAESTELRAMPRSENEVHSASELNQIYSNFLRRQTAQHAAEGHAQSLPPFVQEQKQPFTTLTGTEILAVLSFACVAIVGSIAAMMSAASYPFVEPLKPLLIAVAAYGGIFLLLPLARLPFVLSQNAQVEERNNARLEAAQLLVNPHAELARDQREAAKVREANITGQAKLLYTTEEDILVQSFPKSSLQNL